MAGGRGTRADRRGRSDLAWVERFNLESEGYEVYVATEGRAAIDALEAFEPDVVVLDLMLPHVDGWSVLAKARSCPRGGVPRSSW